jgi:alpha-glucosidase
MTFCRFSLPIAARSFQVLAAFLFAGQVWAASPPAAPDRFVLTQGGVTLEITAPRGDVLRVRLGHPNLPEDASWAVRPEARTARVPLTRSQAGELVSLRTDLLQALVDPKTLKVDIRDASGQPLLQDAGAGHGFDGAAFSLTKVLPEDEHYFGLGDKTGPLDRRGQSYVMWNTDAYGFGTSTDPIYKSIPFVLATNEKGRAYGFFLDNTWRTNFDFGRRDYNRLEISGPGGPVDYYVMAGPDPRAVVQQYAWLVGTSPLPPIWSLGFQQSHWSYPTQAIAQGIVDHYRADRVPLDAFYLDIDYQDRRRPFTVDTKAFPDLPGFTRRLAEQQVHLVLITDLHVAYVPEGGYAPYDSGKAAGIFLKMPDGSDYVGKVWPGNSVFPDFSRPAARDWWGGQYKAFTAMGVHGFWNDMNEPAIFEMRSKTMPPEVVHRIEEPGFAPRNASHAEMHNVYGMLNTRATYEGQLKLAPDVRPFVLTRASYAGGQRYAFTWTGDNVSSWEHLSLSVSQIVNLGLSGFAYAGDDIGGFSGKRPSPELLTRWLEVGAFNPLYRDHFDDSKTDQEVWVDGIGQEAIRRRYISERYRLMPYLYAAAEENSRTGVPIMRPVFLEFPKVLSNPGDHLNGSDAQFMFGASLLVAPPSTWESAAPYKIQLPGPGWYDYWTGERLATAEHLEKPQLERLPVYVRPGSIIPKQPLVQSTMQLPIGPLYLEVYPGAGCQGSVYLDDGTSFAFRRGEYMRQDYTCSEQPDGVTLDIGARSGSYQPWWSGLDVVLRAWGSGEAAAELDGQAMPTRIEAGALHVSLPDVLRGGHLVIRAGKRP